MKRIIISIAIIGSLVVADVSYAQPKLDMNVIINVLTYYGVSGSKIKRIVKILNEPAPVVKPAPKPVNPVGGSKPQNNIICGNMALCVQS